MFHLTLCSLPAKVTWFLQPCAPATRRLCAAGPGGQEWGHHAAEVQVRERLVQHRGLSFIRVKPGMQDDYLNSLRATTKRFYDEEKREGLILSYHIISAPAATPQDWDLLILTEFKNYASPDGLREKTESVMAQTFGGEPQRRTLAGRREEVREIIGSKYGREYILLDSATAGARR